MDAPQVEQPSVRRLHGFFDANGLRDPVGTVRDHEDDALASARSCWSRTTPAPSSSITLMSRLIPLIDQLSALWIEREGCVDDDACGVKRRLALDLDDRR